MNKFFIVMTVCAAFNLACGGEETTDRTLLADTAMNPETLAFNIPGQFDENHSQSPPTRQAMIRDDHHVADWLKKDLGAPRL